MARMFSRTSLGPLLPAAVLTVLLASCGGSTVTNTGSNQSSADAGIISSDGSTTFGQALSSANPQAAATSSLSSADAVPPTPTPAPQAAASGFKDGTYAATGNYMSPAGAESVNVSLTLKKGVVTDATVQGNAQFGKSQMYQSAFSQGFREQVVGKPINSIALGVVNGSSLTPLGFMDALGKIEAQAKA